MGRYANALDWSEPSGVMPAPAHERSESEIRARAPAGAVEAAHDASNDDVEPLTQRFERGSGVVARSEITPSPFLIGLGEVRAALEALVASSFGARVASDLDSSIRSLVHVLGMWRTNLVRQVDDLTLGEDGVLPGSSSLPEYSAAYTLAFVRPALAEAEACAVADRDDAIVGLVREVAASVERLNATLRYRIE